MPRSTSKIKGFTLIEIIVVLVIVGVLAAIALPSIFSWVDKSRAAEVVLTLGQEKNLVAACLQTGKSIITCVNANLLTISTKGFTTFPIITGQCGNGFIFTYENPSYPNTDPLDQYSCNGLTTPAGSGVYVCVIVDASNNVTSVTYKGTGFYKGMF